MSTAANQFDRSKPFYPLVMNYLVQLNGILDLSLRAFTGAETIEELAARIIANHKIPQAAQSEKMTFLKHLDKFAGPLELRSVFQGKPVIVDRNELAAEFIGNFNYLLAFSLRAAGSLLILAHETCKGEAYHNHDPLWEFLRHCRNAAAHGGRFNLVRNEPVRPASWGHLQITRALQGSPLFMDKDGIGLLGPGDPIRLLWDLEDRYRALIPASSAEA